MKNSLKKQIKGNLPKSKSKKQKPTKMIPGCFTWQQSVQGLVYAESQTNQNKKSNSFCSF